SCSAPKSDNKEISADSTEESSPEDTRASPLKNTEGTIGNKSVKIQYSSPAVKDRYIWGDLVPYDEVWRTGANEATFIELAEDVVVEGEPLNAGKYSLFTIPRENGDWTIIFNSEWDLEHGHFQYDEEMDVLRVTAAPEWTDSSQEWLSIEIVDSGIEVKWEKMKLPIHIE
ncbi:MAG: DUF2911 domain-containing protein, partial [Cyclobacteriaceae bacterium]